MIKTIQRLLHVLLFTMTSFVFADDFKAGEDYLIIKNPTATQQPTVVEFFNYGCPACFHLEQFLEPWVKKHPASQLKFSRIPVVFHADWEIYAKAYYIAAALDLLPQANEKFFQAIQVQHETLQNPQDMIQFFTKELKADPKLVQSSFDHAIGIDMQIKEGMMTLAQLEISQIPTFLINGKYITNMSMAKSPERLFNIIDHLIKTQS